VRRQVGFRRRERRWWRRIGIRIELGSFGRIGIWGVEWIKRVGLELRRIKRIEFGGVKWRKLRRVEWWNADARRRGRCDAAAE
jgi:hypothetical protein